MSRQSKTSQLDLFSNPGEAHPPQWQALPEATRLKLTKLFARLIVDHVDGERTAAQPEVTRHDA